MIRYILTFLAGGLVAGVIVWAIPTTCDIAINTVQGAIEGAPGLIDAARNAVSGE